MKYCLISFFLVLTACSQSRNTTSSDGNAYLNQNRSLYSIIAIHPTSSVNTLKAITEFFSGSGYQVINLKETFKGNYSDFLIVTCIDIGFDNDSSFNMRAEVIECTVRDKLNGQIVYKGKGKYAYLVKHLSNFHRATLAALEKFSEVNLSEFKSRTQIDQSTNKQNNQTLSENHQNVLPKDYVTVYQQPSRIDTSQSIKKQIYQTNEKRSALVIGNANYQYISSLPNPRNDANDFSNKLKELGFSVSLLIDASQEEMENSIRDFGRQLTKNSGVGLFYYAGHGIQHSGHNYLIPSNANIEVQNDVKYKAVDLGIIMDEMGEARDGLNIIILDACRNNPLPASSRNLQRGLAQVNGPKGAYVAFATAPGETASDGSGRNGTYTKHLIQNISAKGLALEEVFKNVARGVANETSDKQRPWVNSSFIGDFYFVNK